MLRSTTRFQTAWAAVAIVVAALLALPITSASATTLTWQDTEEQPGSFSPDDDGLPVESVQDDSLDPGVVGDTAPDSEAPEQPLVLQGDEPADESKTDEHPAPSPSEPAEALSDESFIPDSNLCSWRVMSNRGVVNVAFPDAAATYWVMPYLMGEDTRITLEGTFPHARYMSINTYNAQMDTIDTLRDEKLAPNPGSVNPFQQHITDNAAPRSWTATIIPQRQGDHSLNEIGGLDAVTSSDPQLGFVIIRIYASDISHPDGTNDPTGGVPLPTLTIHPGDGLPERVLEPCAHHFDPADATGPLGQALIEAFNRFIEEAASGSFPGDAAEAAFNNPISTTGLFPNGDNKYIATPLSYESNRIVVVRGKAPTYVRTHAGESVAGNNSQLRYWSMCHNDLNAPYPVVACAADFETALDAEGHYTYVVAADGEVPDRAVNDSTVTTIGWGSTDVRKVLFMRHMLPAAEFYPNSVQYSQDYGLDPATTMGDFYPRATYCDIAVYERGGWQECFDDSSPTSRVLPAELAATGSIDSTLTNAVYIALMLTAAGLSMVLWSLRRRREV